MYFHFQYRIFTAPFHHVGFADFWLADQLNSLVTVLLDFEYLVCYYAFEVGWHGGERMYQLGKCKCRGSGLKKLIVNVIFYLIRKVIGKEFLLHVGGYLEVGCLFHPIICDFNRSLKGLKILTQRS